MTSMQKFNHPIFGDLPVVVIEGKEYFGANEVAESLGYKYLADAVRQHCDKEGSITHRVLTNSGNQEKRFITLGNVSRLIVGAAKQNKNIDIQQNAKNYEKWIFDDVIPSIHRHGAYMTPATIEKVLSDPDTIIQLATTLKEAQAKRMAAEALIERQKPKVLFANAVQTSDTSILIGQLAKLITQNGVEIGQNRLFGWMRDNGYLGKRGSHYNEPMQYAVERGWFEVKERTITNPDGSVRITRTTKVTGKGQVYFINKFLADKVTN